MIWQWGALDFAGGTVVHINSAVAGLVGAFLIGKRVGYGKEAMAPHSLPLTMVGASLLWVGWFGFNAGSALEANGTAALAFMNTFSATAAAVLAWSLGETLMRGKASMLGAASGAVAGLVAITPAAGNVGLDGCAGGGLRRRLRLPVGRQRPEEAARCRRRARRVRRARRRRHRRRAADRRVQFAERSAARASSTDWVTGELVKPENYSIASQVWTQLKAIIVTIVWSGVVAFIAYKIVDLVIGLRVSEEEEREGLDISAHGETAYSK